MSCDKLVFDLSQEVEGSPNVFIRKDWLNILDNQNQNYQNNQSIIDTSQLANSNKYMAYREAYLAMPLLLSYRTQAQDTGVILPNDYAVGLKNWFGTMIHSFTLDYNGTTIVQQTPFCNLWNSFKLLTTLSWGDITSMGSSIGFYPDTPDSFSYNLPDYTVVPVTANSVYGVGITNNSDAYLTTKATSFFNNIYRRPALFGGLPVGGNEGSTDRKKWIAFDVSGNCGNFGAGSMNYDDLITENHAGLIWKSYISNRAPTSGANTRGILQISIMATIYMKHVHSFFNMCPLLKGVFMKMTINLNNSKAVVQGTATAGSPLLSCNESTSYVGGTQPILVPSSDRAGQLVTIAGVQCTPVAGDANYDLIVGATCYNTAITNPVGGGPPSAGGGVARSIYLYVPAYTFNPTFEQAYLSNNIKQVKYTDIYQYQFDILANDTFNQLITNGIANIKSVLIIPVSRLPIGLTASTITPEYLSPFSTCGGGTTAPMVSLTNFNVQISGQNAIYNMQRYSFEEWNNQLYGQNAVNGGLTDGLTSGLIDFEGFQTSYCYYYVNVERMLPVEQSVPKSVQIIGQSYSEIPLRFMVFIEYGVQVSIDVLTGARV